MLSLPGYMLSEKIYESPKTIIYRGYRTTGDQQPIIIKQLNRTHPGAFELARFEREYDIARKFDEPGIVECLGLERIDNRPAIVFKDIQGISLNLIDQLHRLNLTALLELAIKIAAAMATIHRRGIIHKDLNPSNIIWNRKTGDINIIDFGISSELARETQQTANPDVLEGTLAYISPEQTGRMNRSIDYRTDMYSFGVTLYELLTGMLPFRTSDSLELVHAHIAVNPAPPQELRPDFPPALFDIIRKLMTKNAEDRYQSARGVISDLSHCLAEIKRHGTVAPFTVAQNDHSDNFFIPQTIYGRQSELNALLEAYDRVCKGTPELVLVSGYPGIGKTVLIQEIQKSLAVDNGYFISGKFEQYKRYIPFACLIDAFSELIRQLLTESSERISRHRHNILAAIGSNGQLLVDHIPDLELIIGKQPPVRELPLAEARNRFHLTFQNFIQVFTSQTFPLVIVIDDLQWADMATLSLLKLFLADPETHSLLIIGAFRENAIDTHHPLMLSLSEIEKTDTRVSRITLEALGVDSVNRMVADTLRAEPKETVRLSREISKKTGGNPFFIRESLKSLYQEGAISFDHRSGRWTWATDIFQKINITDNVVELMTHKILTLEPRVIQLLTLAACIGNRFSIQTLAHVDDKDIRSTMKVLWPAVREELVLPVDKEYRHMRFHPTATEDDLSQKPVQFRFLHDRVQQAAYQMLPREKVNEIHLRIGRVLLHKSGRDTLDDHLFDIVNHYNFGRDLIRDENEIRVLTRLNLKAGYKAKNAAAYDTALVYISAGLSLLPADSWRTDYDLTYSLSMSCAECEYLNGLITKSEARFRLILENVHTDLEKVRVYQIIAKIYQNLGKYKEAVGIGITALELLKIRIPINPGKKSVLAKMLKIRFQLRRHSIDSLRQLPELQDKSVQAIMDTLAVISVVAHVYDRNSAIYNSLTMLELTLKYGNSCHSPFVFSIYSLILCSGPENYTSGYAYGRLAVSMAEDTDDRDVHCKTRFVFARGVNHWVRHAGESLELYRTVYTDGLESGNLVYAGWGALYVIVASIITGIRLDQVSEEIQTYSRFMKRIKYEDILHFCVLPERFIAALRGHTPAISDFSGNDFDEDAYVRSMEAECQFSAAVVWYYIMKIQACYLAGRYNAALAFSEKPKKHLAELKGTLLIPEYRFYVALCLAAVYPKAAGREKKRLLRRLKSIRTAFKKWSANCKDNFGHKYLLICAEAERITGNRDAAGQYYQQAIVSANQSGYLQNEAIANECAAKFYMAGNERDLAKHHMINAHFGYLKWGATGKARQLESDFSFVSESVETDTAEIDRQQTVINNRPFSGDTLDWQTMVKALHAISGEIHLPALIKTLMRITIENAGAQRGVLLLAENDQLLIEAESRADRTDIQLTRSLPLHRDADLPVSMIQYTARKAESVILENAGRHHLFADDPYFRRNRKQSVLCHPILHAGKPIGILYLENDLAPNIFTPDRVQVLGLLSSQAAISLENARLYTRLKESENKYRNIFENAVEGMFQITPDGGILSANLAMAEILGYKNPEELMDAGPDAVELIFIEKASRDAFAGQLLKTGQVLGFEGRGKRIDGREFWASVSTRAVSDDQENLLYYEGTLVDITERKQRDQAERERKAAEASAQSKSVFLANMSHEIRTPLNAITGLSELALMTDLDAKQRDFLNKIKRSAASLLRIIDDILQFSKIEAGRLELEQVDFKLASVLEKIEFMFSSPMSEKGVEMIFSVSDDIPAVLIGDPLRIEQVLINLVSNALKFTEAGEIVVGVKSLQRVSNAIRLQFFVSDTGIGIGESDISKLFDAFVQADGSITRRYGGTGLGLAICKNIVELMNGTIRVEPNEDRGSTFFFEVELGYAGAVEQRRLPENLADRKVIVVDDNPVSRTLLFRQLQNLGLSVTPCESGEEILELFSRADDIPQYDLVIIDWKLPGLDGLETIRRIRKTRPEKLPLFILITAFGWEATLVEIETGDTDAFLTKPIHPAKLQETIIDVFHPESRKIADSNATKPNRSPSVESPVDIRLLLVDDNTINREITTEILQQSGFIVDVAENGQEAIAAVERQRYDTVLMDVQMPVMDGYEATRIIRTNPRNRELVIIAMTAHAMEGYRSKCLEAGMNDYITKPVDLGRLHDLLATYTAYEPTLVSSPRLPGRTALELPANMPGLDIRSAVKRLGGNRNLYIGMIKALYEQYGDISEVLNGALEKGELDTIERNSHTLKGLAGNIGAQALRLSAMRLNEVVKSGRTDEIRSALDELAATLETILPSLRTLGTAAETQVKFDVTPIADAPESLPAALMELDRRLVEGHSNAREYFESIRCHMFWTDLKRFIPQLAMCIENYDYDKARQILQEAAVCPDTSVEGGS